MDSPIDGEIIHVGKRWPFDRIPAGSGQKRRETENVSLLDLRRMPRAAIQGDQKALRRQRATGPGKAQKEKTGEMTVLEKFKKISERLSGWLEWVGIAGILLMMVITCVDVIGAKLFLAPVFGALDIVMLAQLVAISFAGASAYIIGRHVQVEFFVAILPRRAQAVVDAFVLLLGFAFFVVVVWRLFVFGYSFQTGGEVSPTLRWPLHPFAYGAAFAIVPLCSLLLFDFFISIERVFKK
jgi:TRAP-type C4-dicarboxylate transport system permease small subunit